jgi:hypothetical protein
VSFILTHKDFQVLDKIERNLRSFEDLKQDGRVFTNYSQRSYDYVVDISNILIKKQKQIESGSAEYITFEDFATNSIFNKKIEEKVKNLPETVNSKEKVEEFFEAKTNCIDCINQIFEQTNSEILNSVYSIFVATQKNGGFTPTLSENIGNQVYLWMHEFVPISLSVRFFDLLSTFASFETNMMGLNKFVLAHSMALTIPFICLSIGVVDTAGLKNFFSRNFFLRWVQLATNKINQAGASAFPQIRDMSHKKIKGGWALALIPEKVNNFFKGAVRFYPSPTTISFAVSAALGYYFPWTINAYLPAFWTQVAQPNNTSSQKVPGDKVLGEKKKKPKSNAASRAVDNLNERAVPVSRAIGQFIGDNTQELSRGIVTNARALFLSTITEAINVWRADHPNEVRAAEEEARRR